MILSRPLVILMILSALVVGGCGGGIDPAMQPRAGSVDQSGATQTTGETGTTGTTDPTGAVESVTARVGASAGKELNLEPSSCPEDGSNCVVARGTVIYVETVDPDGDGDAHFVTTSRQSVTLPGITIFDVSGDLRPDPLPEPGDLVGGAGPVYPGHAGQKQIEVTEFHVAN